MQLPTTQFIDSAAGSRCGPRQRNEDRYLCQPLRDQGWLGAFAVADGMGGHEGGDVAANIAIDALEDMLGGGELTPAALDAAIQGAQATILEKRQMPATDQLGTTLTVLLLDGSRAYVRHLGDSPLFLLRDGEARRLTDDHSVAYRLMIEGALSAEECRQSPMRHRLYRYLGRADATPAETVLDLQRDDRFVMATDGCELDESRVAATAELDDAGAVRRLLDQGAHDDNATVVSVTLR